MIGNAFFFPVWFVSKYPDFFRGRNKLKDSDHKSDNEKDEELYENNSIEETDVKTYHVDNLPSTPFSARVTILLSNIIPHNFFPFCLGRRRKWKIRRKTKFSFKKDQINSCNRIITGLKTSKYRKVKTTSEEVTQNRGSWEYGYQVKYVGNSLFKKCFLPLNKNTNLPNQKTH